MKFDRAERFDRWIVQIVVRVAVAIVFVGAGLLCVLVGLALIVGPITVYGDPRQPEMADRFQGLAAIGMGSITLFATYQCVREWVAEGGGHDSGTGPAPVETRGDLSGPADVEAACRGDDGEGGNR